MSLMLNAIRRIETREGHAATAPRLAPQPPAKPTKRERVVPVARAVPKLVPRARPVRSRVTGLRVAGVERSEPPAARVPASERLPELPVFEATPLHSAEVHDPAISSVAHSHVAPTPRVIDRPLLLVDDILPAGLQAVAYRALAETLTSRVSLTHPSALTLVSAEGTLSCTAVALRLAALWGVQVEGEVLLVEAARELPWPGLMPVLEARPGITDVLHGRATIDDALQPTLIQHVSRLPVGFSPWNETACAAIPNLWNELKHRYRFIMVDAGVAGDVSATALSTVCDGVCLVVQLEQTSRQAIEAAVARIGESGAPFWGCVLVDGR